MKYYAIKVGRENNVIVSSWAECENLVKGFKGAEYESFKDSRDAESYLNLNVEQNKSIFCAATKCEMNDRGYCTQAVIKIGAMGQCLNY